MKQRFVVLIDPANFVQIRQDFVSRTERSPTIQTIFEFEQVCDGDDAVVVKVSEKKRRRCGCSRDFGSPEQSERQGNDCGDRGSAVR
jgi:hypothetical protein